jgi:hypothetical protein
MTLVNTDAVSNAGRIKTNINSFRHIMFGGMEGNQRTSAGGEGKKKNISYLRKWKFVHLLHFIKLS